MTGSCLRRTRFFVISSMSNGDYMQADRIRYEGHMCTAHYFMTGRGSVLFGMTKTSNQTSNYSVSYLCPSKSVCVCVCVMGLLPKMSIMHLKCIVKVNLDIHYSKSKNIK